MGDRNPYWDRLERVMRQTGHNPNSFAKHIGLPHGENLYQIKRGNNRISHDVAQRIHAKFPEYSISWLMFGIVDTHRPMDADDLFVRLPVYHDRTETFPVSDGPDNYIVLSEFLARGAELATPYADNILNPYLQDALLLLRRHDGPILYGNIYFVETRNFRLFRIVTAVDNDPESVCLTTLQPVKFGKVFVPKKDITALWLVVGAVCRMIK